MKAITAPLEEANLLRFLAVYLNSDFVRYIVLLTAYQVSFERERVSIRDIRRLPFVHPDDHPDPQLAHAIIDEVASYMKTLEVMPQWERAAGFEQWRTIAEALIAQYFMLSSGWLARISEVNNVVLPSVQPAAYVNLLTPLQSRVDDDVLREYTDALLAELAAWRDATGGIGEFVAQLSCNTFNAHGALAVLRLKVMNKDDSSCSRDAQLLLDVAADQIIEELKNKNLLPLKALDNLYLASDVLIRHGNTLYLIKPMVRRMWLCSEAFRDAERIVRFVQGVNP